VPTRHARPLENEYLFTAQSVGPKSVKFGDSARAYDPVRHISSARAFADQFDAFRSFARSSSTAAARVDDTETAIAIGKCVSTFAFAQLVAEHVVLLRAPDQIVSLIFGGLVEDMAVLSLQLAATREFSESQRGDLVRLVVQRVIDRSDVNFSIEWIAKQA
jgi:hypothetical protein